MSINPLDQRGFVTPAAYTSDATRMIGVLHNIQVVLASNQHGTLADVANPVLQLQAIHGDQATLEDIIQHLVAKQLLQHHRQRRAQREWEQEREAAA